MKKMGLYIHWPFCLSKCPYCDFNSHVRQKIDSKRWHQALVKEMEFMAKVSPRYLLRSIFFGGGTPSLMDPDVVKSLIETAKMLWDAKDTLEVTLEANPTSVEAEKFFQFLQAGVNRISLGIQSFNSEALHFLGRKHSAQQAKEAIVLARDIFPSFSFDLIYALPNQTVHDWEQELIEAFSFYPKHLSLYQLTYELGTPFYQRFKRGELSYPSEKKSLEFYYKTNHLTQQKGFKNYEISNYAQEDCECKHNLIYWEANTYVGIGPGAHSRFQTQNGTYTVEMIRTPETWLKRVESSGHGFNTIALLTPKDRLIEILMMGLRLDQGIPLNRIQDQTGKPLSTWIPCHDLWENLIKNRLVLLDENKLLLTYRGRMRLNLILEKMMESIVNL